MAEYQAEDGRQLREVGRPINLLRCYTVTISLAELQQNLTVPRRVSQPRTNNKRNSCNRV